MNYLATITPATSAVMTLAAAKDHLNLGGITDDDALVRTYLDAATEIVQGRSGIRLFTQIVELRLDAWPAGDTIDLRAANVESTTPAPTVKYDDTDDTEQTWASTNYWLDLVSVPARLTTKTSWPASKAKPGAVRIRMTTGQAQDSISKSHLVAVQLLLAHFYENRAEVDKLHLTQIPAGVDYILGSSPDNLIYSL